MLAFSARSNTTIASATSADLSITKTADTTEALEQRTWMYTITVTNSGPDTASAVTITDVLPPQLHFLEEAISTTMLPDFSCTTPLFSTNGTITCSAPRMAPGATATLRIRVRAEPGAVGTVTNTATVTSPTADPDDADRLATAPGVELLRSARLVITNETTTTRARPNSIFTYSISISNRGPSVATDVVMTDELPADLLFEGLSSARGFTCSAPPRGTNGTVTCTKAELTTFENADFTVRVRVASGARPGVVTNRASVTSSTPDLRGGDRTAEAEPVTIAAPAGAERLLDPPPAARRTAQITPQLATTRQNALAVWGEGRLSYVPPGSAAAIRGALFRPDIEGETLITFAAPDWQSHVAYPVVAAAADRYLVVWRETRNPSQGRILARRLRADGSFIDAQPLVLETGTVVACCTDVGAPRPAVASDGRDFYVTWVSANYDVRGIAVPGEGPVAGEPSILSRDTDSRLRGRYDLEVVWTSARYVVVWLDPVVQSEPAVSQPPFVLRYARVTSNGALLDRAVSPSIATPALLSMTATSSREGAVIAFDYEESRRRWCVGAVMLTATGEPGAPLPLRCDTDFLSAETTIHSTFVPVAGGFLLVQPGRRHREPNEDFRIRTFTADYALTRLSDATWLGAFAREVSVATWQGAALLVYNRTVDDPTMGSPRVFAFLIQGHDRARAVRH